MKQYINNNTYNNYVTYVFFSGAGLNALAVRGVWELIYAPTLDGVCTEFIRTYCSANLMCSVP